MQIIWALFDSGNGCYKKTVEKYYQDQFEIYSIGIDIENKNSHFINCNLADYSRLFNEDGGVFQVLDELPKPDIILASPPCESWSNATAMKDGNASWYSETYENLFGEMKGTNNFTIRTKEQVESHNEITSFKKFWWKTFCSRINGELCTFNTVEIINRYKPKVWIIENPQSSKIWDYMNTIHNFKGIQNVAHYCAYDKEFSKKPTTFMSNIGLQLKKTKEKSDVVMIDDGSGRCSISGYNERSNIPISLVKDILDQSMDALNKLK